MLSLVLTLCMTGEPCKVTRIADFYTSLGRSMCDVNRDGMINSLHVMPAKTAAASKFECKTIPTHVASVPPVNGLMLDVEKDGEVKSVALVKFYGTVAAPLCKQNLSYYGDLITAQIPGAQKLHCQENQDDAKKVAGS